jgi:hypothetical protein
MQGRKDYGREKTFLNRELRNCKTRTEECYAQSAHYADKKERIWNRRWTPTNADKDDPTKQQPSKNLLNIGRKTLSTDHSESICHPNYRWHQPTSKISKFSIWRFSCTTHTPSRQLHTIA